MSFVHGSWETDFDNDRFPFKFAPAGLCQECLAEAWERMTYGGVNGINALELWRWSLTIGRSIEYRSWLECF
jgi:hypothetical protein